MKKIKKQEVVFLFLWRQENYFFASFKIVINLPPVGKGTFLIGSVFVLYNCCNVVNYRIHSGKCKE